MDVLLLFGFHENQTEDRKQKLNLPMPFGDCATIGNCAVSGFLPCLVYSVGCMCALTTCVSVYVYAYVHVCMYLRAAPGAGSASSCTGQ